MRLWLLVAGILVGAATLQASEKLETVAIFGDGMVLQAECEVPVWGDAPAGAEVRVEFSGQNVTTVADKNGYWQVRLAAMKKNKLAEVMTINSGKQELKIRDILVGEVWVCSGQSNMEFIINRAIRFKDGQPTPVMQEVKDADLPLLREFSVNRQVVAQGAVRAFRKGSRWQACNATSVLRFSAVGFFFGRELMRELDTPVGLIKAAWGGTQIEAWTRREVLAVDKRGKEYIPMWQKRQMEYDKSTADKLYKDDLQKWQEAQKAAQAAGKQFSAKQPVKGKLPYIQPQDYQQYPSVLYNGMISPIIPYAIKGVLWYQGEANAREQAEFYAETFKAMITDWRKQWGRGDFPFYFVQLANWNNPGAKLLAQSWPTVRQAQFSALALPNTGMAVTIDIGNKSDIHPKNKIEVGRRLALWALAKDYGRKDIVFSGPLYSGATIGDGKMRITFSNSGSGLMVGRRPDAWSPVVVSNDALAGFEVADKEKNWQKAQARIVGVDTVEVWNATVGHPEYVRYGWDVNPLGVNLYNKEGLPASPFNSESK